MIQRIQTVYLLLVFGLLILTMFMPLSYFIDTNGIAYKFTPLGTELPNGYQYTWGILCILILCAIITLATIFLYKNRVLQLRMTIFSSILLIGYYLVFLAFFLIIRENLQATFRINWALCLPLICIILNYLAIRAIGRDEVLVKAADRLR